MFRFFFSMKPPPPRSTLFPYTTLFRSRSNKRMLTSWQCEVRRLLVLALSFISFLGTLDRKSTRLNSSHQIISYAVFCLKKKKTKFTLSHLIYHYSSFCRCDCCNR